MTISVGSLNRAARLMAVAQGGQVVCRRRRLIWFGDRLAEGVVFVDLGEHRLRDLRVRSGVFQVRAPGLQLGFAPLASVDAFPETCRCS